MKVGCLGETGNIQRSISWQQQVSQDLFTSANNTGSQAVKTGSQPVKQEVNKVLKTGFLFYGLTTCVMGRCKQILTYFLLSADAFLDIASLTRTTFTLRLSLAYWSLIILSWANSRLGVSVQLDCQGWLNLPDILLFVLLWFWKKSFQVLISLGDFLLKKPKRGSFVKWCISIFISRIFNIRKLSSSMHFSVGYCELYVVKNQFVTD